MNKAQIIRLRLGVTNTYLIKGKNSFVMVDGGDIRQKNRFRRMLPRLGIHPEQIELIIITHAHYDHVGSLAKIKELCKCQVLIHPHEAALMEQGTVVIPPGTSLWPKCVAALGARNKSLLAFEPVTADLLLEQEYDLKPWGINGCVLPTPGHTPGSISLLLDDGRAFVGDLNMNFFGTVFPFFAEQPEQIFTSWQLLLERGVQEVYPAHGRAFSIVRIKRVLDRV